MGLSHRLRAAERVAGGGDTYMVEITGGCVPPGETYGQAQIGREQLLREEGESHRHFKQRVLEAAAKRGASVAVLGGLPRNRKGLD